MKSCTVFATASRHSLSRPTTLRAHVWPVARTGFFRRQMSNENDTTATAFLAARKEANAVFDAIDVNKDGVLQRNEFHVALSKLHYDELVLLQSGFTRSELAWGAGSESQKSKQETEISFSTLMFRRNITTSEVVASKIFWAGFGWQFGSMMAGNIGLAATDPMLWFMSGLGDMSGVAIGHTIFMGLKTPFVSDINMHHQAQTGLFLGSAAFCSGTAWQPTVNTLQSLGFSFNNSVLTTAIVTAGCFFGGLRLFRVLYSRSMPAVESPNYGNLKADFQLALSVGLGGGVFVGTDMSYGASNWLAPLVGVATTDSLSVACTKAGLSTALGFAALQMVQNFSFPRKRCWVD